MDEQTNFVGQRKRHELTGLEIKLLSPTRNGWYVQVVTAQPDYTVNLSEEHLRRNFRDVAE